MCRFLMVKSKNEFFPQEVLESFVETVKESKTPDGDWQGDGWGICWLGNDRMWDGIKSIHPIWEENKIFSQIPKTRLFLAHARSASFSNQKEKLEYNQPFISGRFVFVFNGFLRGVSMPFQVNGYIGSQKIWDLLYGLLETSDPPTAMINLRNVLGQNSRLISALNVGLCDKNFIFAYCQYTEYPDYYNLQVFDSPSLKIISSESFEGYAFMPVSPKEVLIL